MRRPVRPFVTEYRGGTRRPSQGYSPDIDLFKSEAGKPEARPSAGANPWAPSSDQPEDGYEAALRAADALFAGSRPAESQPSSEGESAKPGAGRVLRVLDEAPSPEMLRLEEEFAPKKRGRKPGSKNKPKVAALAAEAPATPVPALAMANETPALPAAATLTAVLTDAAIAAAARRPAPVASMGPRGERYAWVRTRLKPGQQWKRRLPKVAW